MIKEIFTKNSAIVVFTINRSDQRQKLVRLLSESRIANSSRITPVVQFSFTKKT
jgi:hypothetical protein